MFKDVVKAWVQANAGDFANKYQKEIGRTLSDSERAHVIGELRDAVERPLIDRAATFARLCGKKEEI